MVELRSVQLGSCIGAPNSHIHLLHWPHTVSPHATAVQAGVDLGTVVREHEDAVRTAKKGSSKKGGGGRQRQAALEQAASGVQIRPKRRMPVSKVGIWSCRCTMHAACHLARYSSLSRSFRPAVQQTCHPRSSTVLPPGYLAHKPAPMPIGPCRSCWWVEPRACPPSAALCAT